MNDIPPITILVVDDRAINREFLTMLFGYAGYRVVEAGDGAVALEIARREPVALIISDILMPVMDGVELAHRVHAEPALAHIPIIFYTATYRAQEARALALTCGIATVLAKPSDPQVILDAVSTTLATRRVAIESTGLSPLAAPSQAEATRLQHRLQAAFLATPRHILASVPAVPEGVDTPSPYGNLQALSLRTATLLELGMTMSLEREPQKLIELFCRATQDIMNSGYAAVGMRANGQPRRHAECGLSDVEINAIFDVLDADTGSLHQVLFDGNVLRSHDIESHPAISALPASHPLKRDALLLPIVLRSHPYGWIYVANKLGGAPFNEEDEEFAVTLAAQLAPAYENLVLYDEIQQHAGKLELEMIERKRIGEELQASMTRQTQQTMRIARLSRLYAVLSGINSAIVRLRDRNELFQEACRVAVNHGGFNVAWVGVIDPATLQGEVVAWAGAKPGFLNNIRITALPDTPYSGRPANVAVREKRPFICNNISTNPAVAAFRDGLLADGHRSTAAWPLITNDGAVAVIVLLAPEVDFFDDDECKLLDELAGDLSFGLQFIDKEEKLSYLSYYDVLTGLPNGTVMRDRLTQFLANATPDAGITAVIVLDLQNFAHINDAMGRHAGDAILKEIAKRLDARLKKPSILARISGDTFAIGIPGLQHGTDAVSILEQQIFSALNRPLVVDRHEIRLGVRAGLALYPGDGEDAEALLRHAAVAVNRAKVSGERYLYFAAHMNIAIAARLKLEGELRSALEAHQFIVHYQPRVDLVSGRIVSAEALIRWQHPQRGLISPIEFIPLAEETGLIVQIGAWVIDAVCAQQAAWRKQQVAIVPIAINLSAVQFRHGQLLKTISDSIRVHGLPANCIEFELTESTVMNDPEEAARDLQELKALGIKLALDDFGTGYSSLAYLKRFPFDAVKIDRSFISDLARSPEDAAIVIAVIAMAHSLNLRVVAEGVETEAQLGYLRKHRCDELQGYYFSAAVPVAEFKAMLQEGKRMNFEDVWVERRKR